MIDFKILSRKTLLEITNVLPLRGYSPRSVLLKGPNMASTSEVVYNGVPCPAFTVESMTTVVAQIPESQDGKVLDSIQAFSDSIPTGDASAKITMSLASPLKKVSGLDRLIQTWLVVFMTSRGSSVFAPNSGGGGRGIVGIPFESSRPPISDLVLSVQLTESEILSMQAQTPNIPRSERLLFAPLESIDQDSRTTSIYARVSIRNYLGELASISI